MTDILDEISEDLRQQELKAFWKENGNWIIGGVVAAVIMTGALSYWRDYKANHNMQETGKLISALQSSDADKLTAYAAATDKNHATVARFAAAQQLLQKGDEAKALELYNSISATSGADRPLRDLASLYALSLQIDKGDPAKLHDALDDLIKGSVWKGTALELKAALYAREGKTKEASATLQKIVEDKNLPSELRSRANTMRDVYAGEEK